MEAHIGYPRVIDDGGFHHRFHVVARLLGSVVELDHRPVHVEAGREAPRVRRCHDVPRHVNHGGGDCGRVCCRILEVPALRLDGHPVAVAGPCQHHLGARPGVHARRQLERRGERILVHGLRERDGQSLVRGDARRAWRWGGPEDVRRPRVREHRGGEVDVAAPAPVILPGHVGVAARHDQGRHVARA